MTRSVVLGEGAAVLGAACVALHLAAASSPGHGGWPAALLFVVMAAACLPCIRGLWREPTSRTWAMTAGMYAAMLAAHLLLVTSPWSAVTAHAEHGSAAGMTWAELAMRIGLVLAAVQVVLAGAVLLAGAVAGRAVASRRVGAGDAAGSATASRCA